MNVNMRDLRYWLSAAGLSVFILFSPAGQVKADSGNRIDEAAYTAFSKADSLFEQGRTLYLEENVDKARKKLEKCLKIFPEHADAQFILAQHHYREKDLPAAEKRIRQAIANFDPWSQFVQHKHEQQLKTLGDKKVALQKQVERDRQNLPYISKCINKGRTAHNITMKEEDIARLSNRLTGNGPEFQGKLAEYFYLYGNIKYKGRQVLAAASHYRKAIGINPKHRNARQNLAALYLKAGRIHKAMEHVDIADAEEVDLDPQLKQDIVSTFDKAITQARSADSDTPQIALKRIIVKIGPEGFYQNTYILYHNQSKDAILIDPGTPDPRIEHFITEKNLTIKKILNTHTHSDHTGGNRHYAEQYNVDILAFQQDREASEQRQLQFGDLLIKVLATPGHSTDSVCFLAGHLLISGDTLFSGAIGKTWGQTKKERIQKANQLIDNIKRQLFTLPDTTPVFPGHGASTTIGREKARNPYLNPAKTKQMLKQSLSGAPGIQTIDGATITFTDKTSLNTFRSEYGKKIFGIQLHYQTRR
jgi:glyoxylase-like metal-dependent hydrolase (beta-lactamase superfamily II)